MGAVGEGVAVPEHTVAPNVVPVAHVAQEVRPACGPNVPAAHRTHTDDEVAASAYENVPAGHEVHNEAPAVLE